MSAYRFCRTDDIPLLVSALNRCWRPHFPEEPATTIASFKREIRDIQVWCSSCMVAFAGADPIAVMIGAKRPGATLVHRIAVHPDHQRQGHGRHLLTSLSSKLSILGPPRIVAEVPGTATAAHHLFAACGFARDGCYTDFVLDPGVRGAAPLGDRAEPPGREADTAGLTDRRDDEDLEMWRALPGRFVIPVTIDDLAANGLLAEGDERLCWERSVETLTARKNEVAGIAIATEERIEASLLYSAAGPADAGGSSVAGRQILALRSHLPDAGGLRVRVLLGRLIGEGRRVEMTKVHREEVSARLLEELGFRVNGVHARYTGTARAD